MSKQITYNDSKSFVPDGNTGSVNIGTSTNYPISNGYNGISNTSSSARLTLNASSTSTDCYMYYTFSVDDIPSNAVITSVTCVARAYINNRVSGATLQLYSGTNAKGASTSFSNTSANNITLQNTGSWTASELSSLRLRIQGRRNTTNQNSYIYFYGSDVTINYTVDYTAYEVTSISNTDAVDSIDPQGVTDVISGETYVLDIYADSIDDVAVEDNGVDITDLLVRKESSQGGSESTVLGEYTLISGSFNGNGATYFQGLVGKGVGSTQTTSNYYSNSSGTIAIFTYKLLFANIPSNATITRLYCQVNGHAESTSNSNEYMCVQLRSGNAELSSELNFKSIGTSNSTQTIEATTLPTVAQLSDLVLYCRLGYYGGAINGATCFVEYTTPSASQYYWEYTLSNVTADHTITIGDAIIIPPDEDPQKTYYPITISSINATTEPKKGTTRVESGTSETITITPSDPQLTLALDNGVDITSQLVSHGGTIPTPTVATAQGASYGFTLNSSTGYYVSQNTGVDKSAAVCVVSFNLPVRCLVTIQYINYAEATYDFGIFGNIDVPLTNDYKPASGNMPDSNYKLACNTSTYNTSSVQTLTYEIPSGQHTIYIKYTKDDATSSNNDTLQWKISDIEALDPNNYYTYALSNISDEHSLIFIFGNVQYYFINSSTNSDCMLYPNGQMVQLPGDSYRLTIVPNNSGDTVTLTDNNVDVSSQLERKEVTTEKEGVSTTVVNYIYTLNNIQTAHTLYATSVQGGLLNKIKDGNSWVDGILLKKQDGRWVIVSHTNVYVKGNSWTQCTGQTITTKGIVFGGVVNDGGE